MSAYPDGPMSRRPKPATSPMTPPEPRGGEGDRLKSKVHVEGECWIWKAKVSRNGYGSMFSASTGGFIAAHRLSYMNFVGPIPKEMLVLHQCDEPLCVNPDHLFLGTHAENMADMASKGRAKNGPRATPAITLTQAEIIRSNPELSSYQLAPMTGLNRSSISRFRRREAND